MSFPQLTIDLSSLLRVGHNNLIKDELPNYVLVDGVLLKFEVVVFHWFAFNDLIIILWIVELLEERML